MLVSVSYIAQNNSDQAFTAKAIHELGPPEIAKYFQTVQCFCFAEQTLAPGEEREMVLVYRIDFSAPTGLSDLENLIIFTRSTHFPGRLMEIQTRPFA